MNDLVRGLAAVAAVVLVFVSLIVRLVQWDVANKAQRDADRSATQAATCALVCPQGIALFKPGADYEDLVCVCAVPQALKCDE